MSRTPSCKRTGQAGFTLAGLLVMMTIVMMVIAYTVPVQWSKVMERERDAQTIFLMKQYARAIHNFRAKHNSLPVSLNQIIEARSPRLIRGNGQFIDPLTGRVDWIPVPASAQQAPPNLPGGVRIGTPFNQQQQPQQQQQQVPATPSGAAGSYVGPIIGVRPKKTGPSFLTLNGAETYEQWMFTVNDLQVEIDTRRNGVVTSSSTTRGTPSK